jgi:hypothetical protein
MHYAILLITDDASEEAIDKLMRPHGDGREWDWYQVGGRWSGAFDDYDPETDPANIETCDLCHGTGDRADLDPPEWKAKCGGCNGCQGKGKRAKWPTQWKQHAGDVIPVEQLTPEQLEKFYAFCTDYGWHGGEEWIPWADTGATDTPKSPFRKRDRPPLNWLRERGKYAVVIDCHN